MLQVCTCGKICTNQNLLCLTMGKPENRSFLGWFKWLVSLLQQRKVILRLYIVHGYTPFSDIHMVCQIRHVMCSCSPGSSPPRCSVRRAIGSPAMGRTMRRMGGHGFSQPPGDPVSVRVNYTGYIWL